MFCIFLCTLIIYCVLFYRTVSLLDNRDRWVWSEWIINIYVNLIVFAINSVILAFVLFLLFTNVFLFLVWKKIRFFYWVILCENFQIKIMEIYYTHIDYQSGFSIAILKDYINVWSISFLWFDNLNFKIQQNLLE